MRLQFIWFKAEASTEEKGREGESKADKESEWASEGNRRSRESERNASNKAIKGEGERGAGEWGIREMHGYLLGANKTCNAHEEFISGVGILFCFSAILHYHPSGSGQDLNALYGVPTKKKTECIPSSEIPCAQKLTTNVLH